jgi:hypothetical protein
MSKSIQKNEIIHMDGYYRDPKRDDFVPLIQQVTEQFLENGFDDVGPQITKISIRDAELTKYIDEFIVWNYDSGATSSTEGAYGVDNPTAPTAGQSFTPFYLDGEETVARRKEIDDIYDNEDWHDVISETFPSSTAVTEAGLTADKILGPNVELFAYLNPHPNRRGGGVNSSWATTVTIDADSDVGGSTTVTTYNAAQLSVGMELRSNNGVALSAPYPTITAININVVTLSDPIISVSGQDLIFGAGDPRPATLLNGHFYKESPAPVKIQMEEQQGYVGLPNISRTVYQNEYNKIKRCLTNTARDVRFLPDIESGINTQAKLRQYREEITAQGDVFHHFWISNYRDEFFFPAGTLEPRRYRGELILGYLAAFDGNNLQRGDSYKLTFAVTNLAPNSTIEYEINVSVGLDNSIAGFTQDVYDTLVKTALCDPKGGPILAAINQDNREGVIEFESREVGFYLTVSMERTERPQTVLSNTLTQYTVPVTTANSTITDGTNTLASEPVFPNGYYHQVQIRGFDGCNIGDTTVVTISGLVDETQVAAGVYDTANATLNDIVLEFKALENLNSAQMTSQIVSKLRAIGYINTYMTVKSSGSSIILEYNKNSSAYFGFGGKGRTAGLASADSTHFASTTIGEVTVTDYPVNGVTVADVTALPTAFTVSGTYTLATLLTATDTGRTPSGDLDLDGDPLEIELSQTQSPQISDVSKVRLQFPLARDFGTFANPSNGNWKVKLGADGTNETSYFVSYQQNILHEDGGRPVGPQISFDLDQRTRHPNSTHPGLSLSSASFREFDSYTHEIEIDSFEYITDHSMGPIVLQTKGASSLSGNNGDQPWRIRFDISRGYEVRETSPYINDAVLQVRGDVDASNSFEYFKCHVATEFQLKSDGDVSQIEGRDGVKEAKMREPGFLGAMRPQFTGYLESASHLISPYANREQLRNSVITNFNPTAGLVGQKHYDITGTLITGLYGAFADPSGYSIVKNNTQTVTDGILNDNEYRYEEKFLVGSSTELTYDTPYNSGSLRLQKGWFRRTGKSHPDVAVSYPMSFTATFADHGVAMMIRDQASADQADDHAWFVVQRHVDSITGVSDYSSEHQPIHCVYATSEPPTLFSDLVPYFTSKTTQREESIAYTGIYDVAGNYLYNFTIDEMQNQELLALAMDTQSRFRRFVVREKDILKPWDRHVFAGINETDSHAVINPLEQLSLNDKGQLVIQFPNRLGSQRFLYTGKELDLISFCAAGAVGQDTLISSDRFSTTGTTDKRRLYRGLMSSENYGNGMRLLMLVAGNGVENTDADTTLLTS